VGARTERARGGRDASDPREKPTPASSALEEQRSEVSASMNVTTKHKDFTVATARKVLK